MRTGWAVAVIDPMSTGIRILGSVCKERNASKEIFGEEDLERRSFKYRY